MSPTSSATSVFGPKPEIAIRWNSNTISTGASSARIGYLYTNRTIAQYERHESIRRLIYFPGGAAATPANDYLAARGSCALVAGALPAGCTLNADGSVSYVVPAFPEFGAHACTTINENVLLLGAVARPIDSLRITGDLQFGYNDRSFTRIDPRQVQSYNMHASYKPKPWATLDGAVEIHENRDNVFTVNNLEHDRSYSFSALLLGQPAAGGGFRLQLLGRVHASADLLQLLHDFGESHAAADEHHRVLVSSRRAGAAWRHGLPDYRGIFAARRAFHL